jgi:transposase-like protein
VSTIRRVIEYWLLQPFPINSDLSAYQYLIFDGTFLERRRGIYTVMDAQSCSILHGQHDMTEGTTDLMIFCRSLKERALCPKSATSDGNPHLARVLRLLYPTIIIQRCLVHVQRQGLMWCRRQPKRTDAKRLRDLFLQVMSVTTIATRDQFLAHVQQWEANYGHRIASSPETGWVFSDLKRARSMLLAALPDMFHFLSDVSIPRTTNALEGYFGRLKHRYRQHRGLARRHRKAYFLWYLSLCSR